MPFTTYLINKIEDLIFGAQSYSVPATLYVGLCTGCTSGGTVTGEPAIGSYGYTRVAVTNNDLTTTWSAAAAGAKTNGHSTVQWGTVTTTPWGTLTTVIISDAASGGNILAYGALGGSITALVGMAPYIMINQLIISMT